MLLGLGGFPCTLTKTRCIDRHKGVVIANNVQDFVYMVTDNKLLYNAADILYTPLTRLSHQQSGDGAVREPQPLTECLRHDQP